MKSRLSVDKRWKLCIFASFMAIPLLLGLKQGRGSINISSLLNMGIWTASSENQLSASKTELSKPPEFIDNGKPLDPRAEKSNSKPSNFVDNGEPLNPREEKPISKPPNFVANRETLNPREEKPISKPPNFVDNGEPLNPKEEKPISKPSNFIDNGKPLNPREEKSISKPSSSTDNGNPSKPREEKCNIFDGKWVYEPEANPHYHEFQCPFLSDQVSCQSNGRPDSEYEKWGWKARECDIPRFDGTEMLERLRGKRVILVGDSLNRNQFESLACLLYSAIPQSRAYVDVRSGVYKIFRAKDYKCSVEFYWSPFIVHLRVDVAYGSRMLELDKLPASAQQWKGADIMVFNTGHWWAHTGKIRAWDHFECKGARMQNMDPESALEIAMKTWSDWIDHNVDSIKTTVFFRSTSATHMCYRETQPLTDESYQPSFPKNMTQIIVKTMEAMRTPVRYLNITKLTQYRRDAHPTVYKTKEGKSLIEKHQEQPERYADCSHWCLPGVPDTWNRLLYASMVIDPPGGSSSSSHVLV